MRKEKKKSKLYIAVCVKIGVRRQKPFSKMENCLLITIGAKSIFLLQELVVQLGLHPLWKLNLRTEEQKLLIAMKMMEKEQAKVRFHSRKHLQGQRAVWTVYEQRLTSPCGLMAWVERKENEGMAKIKGAYTSGNRQKERPCIQLSEVRIFHRKRWLFGKGICK